MSTTNSKKRKISEVAATKYYAVRTGHHPGIYTTYADCQEQTTGFRGAIFKSFTSEQDAADFVAGKDRPSVATGDKFYGVAVGTVPGVYEHWADAQEQIRNVKGPKYKKFATRDEALEFVRSGGKIPAKQAAKADKKGTGVATIDGGVKEPTPKKARTSSESVGPVRQRKLVKVFTDGSSRGNGKVGAIAGVGVYFGDNDPRNVSEPLAGTAQTNQRAELTAVQRALEIVPKDQDIQIITDSNYSINCCEVWYKNWQRNGWKATTGAPVTNKDLVVAIRKHIDERDQEGAKTNFQWIKGHSADPGNEAADRLAVSGAMTHRG